jgi:ectoine hydroxylase-related dioxygenase (phytanoyl-CoA dioxygenase family)
MSRSSCFRRRGLSRFAACGSRWRLEKSEHGNRTGARRVGIAMNYCAGWMRQQENQQLGIPLDVARGFSARLRKLAGFGIYRNLIGHIDKCSPADLLDGTGPHRVVGE